MKTRLGRMLLVCVVLAACGKGGGNAPPAPTDPGGGNTPPTSNSIVGTWYGPSHCVTGCELTIFLSGGTGLYGLYWPDHPEEPGFGAERFTYTRDSARQTFSVTGVQMDTTNDWNEFEGDPPTDMSFVVTGAGSGTWAGGSLARLTASATNALQGTWIAGEPATGSYVVLVVIDGTRFMLLDELPSGPRGNEFGTYTWNATSGAFVATLALGADNDGAGAGFSASTAVVITVSGSTATVVIDGGAPVTATRLEP